MDLNKFQYDIQKTRPEPLTTNEREYLWSRIDSRTIAVSALRKQRPSFVARFVAGMLAILLFGGGLLTVSASDAALPGDVLYPIELVLEKAQIAVVPEKKKNELRIKFAEERLVEVQTVIERDVDDGEDSMHEEDNILLVSSTTAPLATSTEFQRGRIQRDARMEDRQIVESAIDRVAHELDDSEYGADDHDTKAKIRSIAKEVEELKAKHRQDRGVRKSEDGGATSTPSVNRKLDNEQEKEVSRESRPRIIRDNGSQNIKQESVSTSTSVMEDKKEYADGEEKGGGGDDNSQDSSSRKEAEDERR